MMGHGAWSEATAYEAFMGRWSRAVASAFVSTLAVPGGAHWLDLGCGTGALTKAILDHASPASVLACDPSENFVAFARSQQPDRRARFEVASASRLPRRDPGFDVIASNLVLNFLPDAPAALRAMRAATRPGGVVAASVWDYADGMEFLRVFWDVARALDPGVAALDEGERFPLCDPVPLAALFQDAGLADVVTTEVVIQTRFADFADYWTPFLGGVGPAGAYVTRLGSAARDALALALRRRLPPGTDGQIALTARAWVVRGHHGRTAGVAERAWKQEAAS